MSIEKELQELLTDDLVSVQFDRELATRETAVERAYEQMSNVAMVGGDKIFKGRWEALIAAAETLQAALFEEGSQTGTILRILSLTPQQLVAVYHGVVLGLAVSPDGTVEQAQPANTVYRRLGNLVGQQARTAMLKLVRTGSIRRSLRNPLTELAVITGVDAKKTSRIKGRQVENALQHPDELKAIEIGRHLYDAFEPVMEDVLLRYKHIHPNKRASYLVVVRENIIDDLIESFISHKVASTPLGFMVCEPLPLTETDYTTRGRYVSQVGGAGSVTPICPSPELLSAANEIQRSPYSVNPIVAEAIAQLTEEQADMVFKVEEVPTEAGEDESARQFALRVRSVETANRAKRAAREELLAAASEGLQHGRFYFPCYLDFRGRIYQVDYKGMGPQGSKAGKALLQMGTEGVELGQNGLWWAYHELGNSMGYDKLSLDEKVAKAKELPIHDLKDGPQGTDFWLHADEPLKALAVAEDIRKALESGSPETYKSQQFGYVDGSCNGMQHLSLLTRDVHGALATNVISCEDGRQDLYGTVAANFLELLEADKSPAADHWRQQAVSVKGGMRAIVKRATMTQSYGVTSQGIRDQAINDGYCSTKDRSHEGTKEQARLFQETVEQALAHAMPKAMELRKWIVDAVERSCKAGIAPEWTTPVGTRVVKRYCVKRFMQVRIGKHKTNLPKFDHVGGKPDIKKNKSSIVANIIHSFDAAMLQDTTNRFRNESESPITFVHDSYGTAFGDMDLMSRVLRESAKDIYSQDRLAILAEELQRGLEVKTQPPELGELRVEDVMDAEYFFA